MPRLDAAVTVIGYGSLVSALGLAGLAPLPVTSARRVRLLGCRRGFGKLSEGGDRLAMVLEPLARDVPISAEMVTTTTPLAGHPEGIAFATTVVELARIAAREGYTRSAIEAIVRTAAADGTDAGSWLWHLAESVHHDVVAYRRALFAATGFTSAHYVPHPVARPGSTPAIVFLPPGAEGSGADAVVPVRVRTAMDRLLTVREVWRVKPTPSQLAYVAHCLLGEAHNVSFGDVAAGLADYAPLADLVRAHVAATLPEEPARLRATLGIDRPAYDASFPALPRRGAFFAAGVPAR